MAMAVTVGSDAAARKLQPPPMLWPITRASGPMRPLNGESGSSARDWTFEIGMRVFFPPPRDTYSMMQAQKGGGR